MNVDASTSRRERAAARGLRAAAAPPLKPNGTPSRGLYSRHSGMRIRPRCMSAVRTRMWRMMCSTRGGLPRPRPIRTHSGIDAGGLGGARMPGYSTGGSGNECLVMASMRTETQGLRGRVRCGGAWGGATAAMDMRSGRSRLASFVIVKRSGGGWGRRWPWRCLGGWCSRGEG